MGFGRYITGPREIVAPIDPAIDDAASDMRKWREDLYDSKHLKFKPGEKPTVWKVTQLTEPQKRIARSFGSTDSYEFLEFVFRCGIAGIDNYTVQEGDSVRNVPQPDRKDRPPYGECASQEWLDGSHINHQEIEMVGMLIWSLSEARPLSSKPSEQ